MSTEVLTTITEQEAAFGCKAVAIYRGWDELEKHQSQTEAEARQNAIIDVDLASRDIEPTHFKNRKEAGAAIAELAEQLHATPNIRTNRELIAQKLAASLVHIRIRSGEDISFKDHLKMAMRVFPIWVPEGDLVAMRGLLNQYLPVGMEYRREDKDAFEQEFIIEDSQEIERLLTDGIEAGKMAIGQFVELPSEVVVPEIVDVPKTWSGYVSTDEKGQLYFKVNKNAAYKYNHGEILTLGGHEYGGHIVQLGVWSQDIAQSGTNPFIGITTLHTPECVAVELVGQLGGSALFVESSLDITKYQIVYDEYKTAVYNNISLMAHDVRFTAQEIKQYAEQWLQFEEEDHLEKVIETRQDPRWSAYLAGYWKGALAVRSILSQALEVQKVVIPEIYKPHTMAEISNIVARPENWQ